MKSYGVVKNTYIQQQCNYINVKIPEQIDSSIQVDKILHPSPMPKPPDHVISHIIQQRPYHVIQKYPRDKALSQEDIFDNIIASNINSALNKNDQLLATNKDENTNRVTRQGQPVERYTRKPIFNKKNQQDLIAKKLVMSSQRSKQPAQNYQSDVKQFNGSESKNLSKIMGNKRSIFSLQNKLYHEVMIPAYEQITKQLQLMESKMTQTKKNNEIQIQRSETSKKDSIKSYKNSEKSKDYLKSEIKPQKEQKFTQMDKIKLKLESNVTNLQIISKLQQVKSNLKPVKDQLQRSEKLDASKQLLQRKPQTKNTKKRQPSYSNHSNKSINIQYPHPNANYQEIIPINIKININLGDASKKPKVQNKRHQQQDCSSFKSVYSHEQSQKSVSSVLNQQESKKRQLLKLANNNQKLAQSDAEKMIFNKVKSNSSKTQRESLNGSPSILKLKPKGNKLSSQASNKEIKNLSQKNSSISLQVYSIKGINPFVI